MNIPAAALTKGLQVVGGIELSYAEALDRTLILASGKILKRELRTWE